MEEIVAIEERLRETMRVLGEACGRDEFVWADEVGYIQRRVKNKREMRRESMN